MSWLASRVGSLMGAATGALGGGSASSSRGEEQHGGHPPSESLHPALSMLRGAKVKGGRNVARNLIRQQQTGYSSAPGAGFTTVRDVISCFRDRLDLAFEGVPVLVLRLEDAIRQYVVAHRMVNGAGRGGRGGELEDEWRAVSDAVSAISHKLLLDMNHSHHDPHRPGGGDQLQRDREMFSTFLGPEALLKLFDQPFATHDARDIPAESVHERAEVWNDVLVLLRELCYAVPDVARRLYTPRLVLFLFTMLGQPVLFDHTVGLIEEILADQAATFFLGSVPRVASLLRSFSLRQLAHFCRIMALLVFEPEDRQMESAKVLKSLDILQLRRDRMMGASATIDRNQALILAVPDLLARLVQLLRVMNYSPPISALSHSHMAANMPPFEALVFLGNVVEQEDPWSSFDRLAALADSEPMPPAPPSAAAPPASSSSSVVPPLRSGLVAAGASVVPHLADDEVDDDYILEEAYEELEDEEEGEEVEEPAVAAEAAAVESGPARMGMPVGELMNILGPLLTAPSPPDLNVRQVISLVQTIQALGGLGGSSTSSSSSDPHQQQNPAAPIVLQRLNRRSPPSTPAEARNELQFQALLLTPYQVEVLFVLCTLLGGRRKVDVQHRLAEMKLVDILNVMFDRLSWGSPNPEGPNPLERIHGPGCECNPESALRVQFLRLVHNYADRDCENSRHKHLLLSPEERRRLSAWDPTTPMCTRPPWGPDVPKGLLSKIVAVLMRESGDSIYRFWLSSCVESFLRGSSAKEQLFVVETGLLQHLLTEILSPGLKLAGNLQTAFDLLGELSKCNRRVLEKIEAALSEEEFGRLFKVVSSSLIDSNVFIRSLLLGLHGGVGIGRTPPRIEEEDEEEEGEEAVWAASEQQSGGRQQQQQEAGMQACGRSYLLHSWLDVAPVPVPALSASQEADEEEGHEDEDHCSQAALEPVKDAWPEQTDSLRIGDAATQPANAATYARLQRLVRFLSQHHVRLLRDLMSVVSLSSVDHESICCLNTAIVIFVFANRRGLLANLLSELRAMQASEEAEKSLPPSSPPASASTALWAAPAADDSSYGQDSDREPEGGGGCGGCACHHHHHHGRPGGGWLDPLDEGGADGPDKPSDFLANFRELCWFWRQYYEHRGRDRLSLEFSSSHISFSEWKHVVDLLCADEPRPTALVHHPIPLPTSPYALPPSRARVSSTRVLHEDQC